MQESKNYQDYLERLSKMRDNIYMDGELVSRTDSRVINATKSIKLTYDMADDPDYKDLMITTSSITGKEINRFNHINQSVDDLLKKQEMVRKLTSLTGGCIHRCMGTDAMNGLSVITKDTDLKYGTNYNERFLKYLAYFQENNLIGCCAQTDAKGDRSLRPAQQADPDQYLHVVERRTDGVVVRGAKLHNTIAQFADEIIAIPTRAIMPDEKDYAIAFAIPADTEGVYLIGRRGHFIKREEEIDAPISEFGCIESFTVFDNVFIPNERIFINGETDMAGMLALYFALFHRHSYTGCKPGTGDVLLGTTALVADYLGIEKKSHVKEKLAELISVAELVYASGIASAVKSTKAASGTQVPDMIFANVGRRHAGHNIAHEYDILTDIAGGLPATLPLSKEYTSPVVGKFVKKYCSRRAGVSAENHYRAAHLASDLLTSDTASELRVAGVHGGGSPVMEDIAIMGSYDVKSRKNLAKHLAGIKED